MRRTAKNRVYYRYVDGVKMAYQVEAKLGAKAKNSNLTYNRPEEILEKVNAAFGEG